MNTAAAIAPLVFSVENLLGGRKVLHTKPRTALDWISVIRQGISSSAVDVLTKTLHVTQSELAAALGIPVYSIFRGRIGAVDRYLAEAGRLILLETEQDVRAKIVLRRRRAAAAPEIRSTTLCEVVDEIVKIVESKGRVA